MPLYEYLCRDCDQQIELLVRSPDEKISCRSCGSTKLMKLLSVPASPCIDPKSGPEPGEGPCEGGCGCFPG